MSGNADALLSPDGLHPNDAGYDVMAQKVFEKIQENFETVRADRAVAQSRRAC